MNWLAVLLSVTVLICGVLVSRVRFLNQKLDQSYKQLHSYNASLRDFHNSVTQAQSQALKDEMLLDMHVKELEKAKYSLLAAARTCEMSCRDESEQENSFYQDSSQKDRFLVFDDSPLTQGEVRDEHGFVFRLVQRVNAKDLSYEQFFRQFSLASTPVIIEGALDRMFISDQSDKLTNDTTFWGDINHLRKNCGHILVKPSFVNQSRFSWAGFMKNNMEPVSFGEFLDYFESHLENDKDESIVNSETPHTRRKGKKRQKKKKKRRKELNTDEQRLQSKASDSTAGGTIKFTSQMRYTYSNKYLYVYDRSMAQCFNFTQDFIMPNYFAGDYMLRVPQYAFQMLPHYYAWPSIFVGNAHTGANLHVDAMGTSFWMMGLKGTKHWRFVSRQASLLLHGVGSRRPDFLGSHDERIPQLDLFNLNASTYPMTRHLVYYDALVQPGDLLFVPANWPHQVYNLDNTIALAGNFIDAANFRLALNELMISRSESYQLPMFLALIGILDISVVDKVAAFASKWNITPDDPSNNDERAIYGEKLVQQEEWNSILDDFKRLIRSTGIQQGMRIDQADVPLKDFYKGLASYYMHSTSSKTKQQAEHMIGPTIDLERWLEEAKPYDIARFYLGGIHQWSRDDYRKSVERYGYIQNMFDEVAKP